MQEFEKGSQVKVVSLVNTTQRCGLSSLINMQVGEVLEVVMYDRGDDTYKLSNHAWYVPTDLEAEVPERELLGIDDVAVGDLVLLLSSKYTDEDYDYDDEIHALVGDTFIISDVDDGDDSVQDRSDNWYSVKDLEVVKKYSGLVSDDIDLDDEVRVISTTASHSTFGGGFEVGDTFTIDDIDTCDNSVFDNAVGNWIYLADLELVEDEGEEGFPLEVEAAEAPVLAQPCVVVEPVVSYLITPNSVTLVIDGDSEVTTSDHVHFEEIRNFVIEGEHQEAMRLMNVSIGITNWGQGALQIENGTVVYNGMELTGKLIDRIVDQMVKGDTAFERFAKFLNLTMAQESFKTRERLMDFAAHDKLDINKDGFVVAFKNVASNYMDKHSGTFDNHVGESPALMRSMVNDDHDVQCAAGLHVCSPEYLKGFWGTSGKTMRVVVDPRDFVAIPYDYNDSKARVCKYTVVEDVTDKINEYF